MKREQWFFVFSMVPIVLGLFLLEEIVRFAKLAPVLPFELQDTIVPNEYLPYMRKPLSSARVNFGKDMFSYKYNSAGLRDVEHSLKKHENVFRILGLGDSFTHGSGVAFKNTYLYRLEEMLNRRDGIHPKVEIIKAGISRFFPEPERIYFEHYGIQYKPDLVMVGFLLELTR